MRDSHITIWSDKLGNENGFTIPLRFAKLGGKTIVVETMADSLSKEGLPIPVGTEILKIEDKGIDEFEREWLGRISASSPNAAYRNLYSYLIPPMPLCGRRDSEVQLLIQRPDDGSPVKVVMKRNTPKNSWLKKDQKPAFRYVRDGILYIDLSQVSGSDDWGSCLRELTNAQSAVLDLRKRPKWGSVKELLSPFYSGVHFMGWEEVPIVEAPTRNDTVLQKSWKKNDYWFVNENKTVWNKPLVILIDEHSQSGTEGLALLFRLAGGGVCIGSQTASTTGAITYIHIPNFGYCSFTGCRVKYPDGKLFYANGVSPDIVVRPTIEGIRTGRDEVLETAVKYLQTK